LHWDKRGACSSFALLSLALQINADCCFGCGVAAAPVGRRFTAGAITASCRPFRSEIFAPTRTAQGNEIVLEQGGKHKNKLKLKLKHNNKRKELTRADRLHKSKRRQHVFLDAGPNWIEISFFLYSKQLKISDAARRSSAALTAISPLALIMSISSRQSEILSVLP
jgi:hypothetical protein